MIETKNQKIISVTFDWYLQNIMPIVEKHAIQSPYGYHGLYTHTAAVVFRGIDYALSIGVDPKNVVFACAFHDMARTHDFADTKHGANAIPMACKAMNEIGNITDKSRKAIIYAVKNHSFDNLVAPDYISACMWDADRTRLSWEYYNSECFSTKRAKEVAAGSGEKYLEFMKNTVSEYARQLIEFNVCF